MRTRIRQAPVSPTRMSTPMEMMHRRMSVVASDTMVVVRFSSSASWTPLPLKSPSVVSSARRTTESTSGPE